MLQKSHDKQQAMELATYGQLVPADHLLRRINAVAGYPCCGTMRNAGSMSQIAEIPAIKTGSLFVG